MPRIYKYRLKNADAQTVTLPVDSEILSIQNQENHPVMWALIPQDAEDAIEFEDRTIKTFGTGHYVPSDPNLKYISTTQFNNGSLVFHYFEQLKA